MLGKVVKHAKRDGLLVTADLIIRKALQVVPDNVYQILFAPDVRQRYSTVVSAIQEANGGTASILDVGSGREGIGRFIPRGERRVVCLDVALGSLEEVRQAKQVAVLGSGSHMPFRDDAFDVVVSVHTLEHVPSAERVAFLGEMKRASRRMVVVLTPCGEHGEHLAERLLGWKPYRESYLARTTEEHLRYGVPLPEILTAQFPRSKLSWKRNEHVQWVYFALLSVPILRWLSGILYHVLCRCFDSLPPYTECLMSWTKSDGLDQETRASVQIHN